MSRQRSMEAIMVSEYVTIGELVRLTETRYSTLKFYTEEGFLPFVQEGSNLTRRYPRDKTIERIAYIKRLRDQKKTIPQIKEILQEIGSSLYQESESLNFVDLCKSMNNTNRMYLDKKPDVRYDKYILIVC